MKKAINFLLFLSLILMALIYCTNSRRINLTKIEKKMFRLVPEKQLPKDDLPSERIKLEIEDRILYANWVSAGKTSPAFLILHGNGESISDWRPVQAYLLQKGYSSFVFDYSGFGSSTGQPSVKKLNKDAIIAYKKFASLTNGASEQIAFGHSLGTGVLLDIANKLKPLPDKVVVIGTFTTARAILVEKGVITNSEKKDYPDVWNGLKNVQRIKAPLYILHSINDKVVPIYMSEELAKSAGSKAKFLKLDNPGHNAVYQFPNDSIWNPIFNFIK